MLEEANFKFKRENESLTQKFIASTCVVSDLNTKNKDLENDKLSLLTTIKLFQIQGKSYEVACLSNKSANINVSSDSNYKDDIVQISLSSDEENFTGKASGHRKLNRKYTKSKKNKKNNE